jgi:hypothetical protein
MLAVFNLQIFKMILNINFLIIGYTDRRRHNDNESTTYDAQEMNGD